MKYKKSLENIKKIISMHDDSVPLVYKVNPGLEPINWLTWKIKNYVWGFLLGKTVKTLATTENGTYFLYYEDDILHREDGPAVVSRDNKVQVWVDYGDVHREDGPAVIYYDREFWYINDIEITDKNKIDAMKFKALFTNKKNLF
jgi:hypothetical protein